MEKTTVEYLKETIAAYDGERDSQENYLKVFFALIDVGMSNEPLEMLMLMGRGDDGTVADAPYQGVMKSGEKLLYIFTDTEGRAFTDGLFTKKVTVRQICNYVAENQTLSSVLFSLPSGEYATFSREDIALLLLHLDSPAMPCDI